MASMLVVHARTVRERVQPVQGSELKSSYCCILTDTSVIGVGFQLISSLPLDWCAGQRGVCAVQCGCMSDSVPPAAGSQGHELFMHTQQWLSMSRQASAC